MARRKIAVIDSETDPFEYGVIPKPFIWGFYDGDEYREFYTDFKSDPTPELVEFLEDKRLIVYAHNGGKFDYHFLIEYLEPFSDILLINNRMAKFKIGDCEYRDSFNILPVPLAAMQKTEIDYDKFRWPERLKHEKEIRDYLRDDCVFLYEYVNAYIDQYGLNLTVAGTAMKQWTKIRGETCPNSGPEFYQALSPYYYGGRVECFQSGIFDGDFASFDINSAYPFAMLHAHPCEVEFTRQEFGGVVKPTNFYDVRCVSRGAFPFRVPEGDDKGKLIFPRDDETRTYFVTGWELQTAIETATISDYEILQEIETGKVENFKPYVDHFYELKKNAKSGSPEYLFAKLFLNSLYGKFGANPAKYTETFIINMKFIEAAIEDGAEFAGELGPWALMREDLDDEKMRFYNIACAASITGFVRAYLWRHIHALAVSGNSPIYCDTDCIFFKRVSDAEKVFDCGPELGQWEHESDYDRGGVAGKKLYAWRKANTKKPGWKIASKGAKLTHKQIMNVARGATEIYEPIAPTFSPLKPPSFLSRKITKTA